jgi:hypothetical protein
MGLFNRGIDLLLNLLADASTGDVTATNTPTKGDNTKKLATMEAVQTATRNRDTITSGTTALTYNDHGLHLVDASGGNVTINLPAASAVVTYRFRRIDSSANTVTINRNGTDTIEGGTSITLVGSNASRTLDSDSVSKWYANAIQEQGTFTPTARGTGTTGTFTYTAQSGSWQRVGNRVFFSLNIGWSATTGTGGIRVKLNDIPYLPNGAQQVACSIRTDGLNVGADKQLQAYVTTTNNEIVIEAMDPTGTATADVSMDTVIGQMMIAGSFLTT